MATVINPLNLYGPYIPTTFEVKSYGNDGVDENKVNEMIDDKLENAVFVD